MTPVIFNKNKVLLTNNNKIAFSKKCCCVPTTPTIPTQPPVCPCNCTGNELGSGVGFVCGVSQIDVSVTVQTYCGKINGWPVGTYNLVLRDINPVPWYDELSFGPSGQNQQDDLFILQARVDCLYVLDGPCDRSDPCQRWVLNLFILGPIYVASGGCMACRVTENIGNTNVLSLCGNLVLPIKTVSYPGNPPVSVCCPDNPSSWTWVKNPSNGPPIPEAIIPSWCADFSVDTNTVITYEL